MLESMFIVLARAIHVMSGVLWAGGVFVMAIVIVPLVARHGPEGAGRWLAMAGRRTGIVIAASAPLAILSGMYLFATLHPHDESAGGIVLKAGAAAALLSAVVGVLFVRNAARRLHQLGQASAEQAAPSPEATREFAALRIRMAVSTRVAGALLGVTVLAMATYRYASALL